MNTIVMTRVPLFVLSRLYGDGERDARDGNGDGDGMVMVNEMFEMVMVMVW